MGDWRQTNSGMSMLGQEFTPAKIKRTREVAEAAAGRKKRGTGGGQPEGTTKWDESLGLAFVEYKNGERHYLVRRDRKPYGPDNMPKQKDVEFFTVNEVKSNQDYMKDKPIWTDTKKDPVVAAKGNNTPEYEWKPPKDRDVEPAVEHYQKKLMDIGYDLGPDGNDGLFGDDTKSAIINFQKDNDLEQTGKLDHATMRKINEKWKPSGNGNMLSVNRNAGLLNE